MSDGFEVHHMVRADLDLAVEWAAVEGWNPGLHDADCFWAADPGGYFIGRVAGEPVSSISAVRYGNRFAFVGFYLCRPGQRGRGYGLRTWAHAFDTLRAPTVGLDGVIDQQDNYARSGFTLAHRNVRYGGTVATDGSVSGDMRVLGRDHLRELNAYDRRVFGCERLAFLEAWSGAHGHVVVGAYGDGALTGYGIARPCRTGTKIGPLFADSRATAEALFDALVAKSGSGPVYLDVPEPNREAADLAESRGLSPVFETARMYRGTDWPLPLDRIFGITTFELG